MFSFILTEECNWNCRYCQFPKIKEPKHASIESIKSHIDYIKDINNVINDQFTWNLTIQGGEIGFVPIDVLEYLFTIWEQKISISTNGEFFRRNYHKNTILKPKIDQMLFHLTDDLHPREIVLDYDLRDIDVSLNIGICDITRTPDRIRKFLKINSKIYFNFVDYEHNIDLFCDLQPSMYIDLYNNIKDLDNVSDYAKERIEQKIGGRPIQTHQNTCSSLSHVSMIDFINERIVLCVRNYNTSFIELTKENLIKVLTTYNSFNNKDLCNNCFRMCQEIDTKRTVNLKTIYRKRLKCMQI